MPIDYIEIVFRFGVSVLIGCIIGLDRNLHGKPTGVKTLGLVALGACLVTMASTNFMLINSAEEMSSASRVIQGVITGIGFLGAGVILHDESNERVRGLTTAASIWVTAAIGIVCGMGFWKIAVIALVIVLMLFVIGRPLERALHRHWLSKSKEEKDAISKHEE